MVWQFMKETWTKMKEEFQGLFTLNDIIKVSESIIIGRYNYVLAATC